MKTELLETDYCLLDYWFYAALKRPHPPSGLIRSMHCAKKFFFKTLNGEVEASVGAVLVYIGTN